MFTNELDDIFTNQELLNVFFDDNMKNLICLSGDTYIYYTDTNYIIPVQIRRKACFIYAVFLSEPYLIKKNPEITEQIFLDCAVNELKKKYRVQWVISTASGLFSNTPSQCKRIPFGSHIINLSKDEMDLMAAMNGKHRNVIKKAIKDGVKIKIGHEELLDDYMIADRQTWERSGGSSGDKRTYYLNRLTALKDNIILVNAYLNEEIQAGGIFYYNKKRAYYMYGASIDNPTIGAANYVQWETMRYMKRLEVEEYSFVGCRINEDDNSKYHGIQRFKERFGGILKEGYLFRCNCNPIMYKLFCLAMKIIAPNHETYKDAIDQEIYKWSDIQTEKDR